MKYAYDNSTGPVLILLTVALILISSGIVNAQEVCPSLPSPIPSPPPCPSLAEISEKWDLWRVGTCLRGANIWQKRVARDDRMGHGPVGPPYAQRSFDRLASWGANYVNISHPGIFSERPDSGGNYHLEDGVLNNLRDLIDKAQRAGLMVVVSYRTGPGRNEAVFVEEGEGALLKKVWSDKKAQDAWVEMWRQTARALKDKENVVGYDLMVEPGGFREGNQRARWNVLAGRLVAAIREEDRRTPILIGPADGSVVDALGFAVPNGDAKTVYAVHQYRPDEYAQAEEGAAIDFPGGVATMPTYLQALYDRVAQFRTGHANVPVAVNEFGAVRYAPRAECYVQLQADLIERLGANHALWLWETDWDICYDQFNFRNGPDTQHHAEVEDENSELIRAIKYVWRRNTLDVRATMRKFVTSITPPPSE